MATRSDAQVSRDVAQEAGRLLLALRADFGPIADRAQADELRAQGDRTAHEVIVARLAVERPDDCVLSEEGKDDPARLTAERLWIVDPLDGTWEYGQGRSDFAVHVALWEPRSRRLSAATVDLPAQGLTRSVLATDSTPADLPSDRPLRVVASRSRPPACLPRAIEIFSERLATAGISDLGAQIVDVGSVGAKVNEVISGRAEAYVHDTGFYEWDVAAPVGIAVHHGYCAAHVDGSALVFNAMPPYVSDLVVSHPAVVDLLRLALAEAKQQ